jgi:hypothetical protein
MLARRRLSADELVYAGRSQYVEIFGDNDDFTIKRIQSLEQQVPLFFRAHQTSRGLRLLKHSWSGD